MTPAQFHDISLTLTKKIHDKSLPTMTRVDACLELAQITQKDRHQSATLVRIARDLIFTEHNGK